MKDLAGRTAIVTGASRGIGVHVSRALADQGMNLVLAARSAEGLEAVRTSLSGGRGRIVTVPTDVSRLDELERLVEASNAEFGAIDVLVNNAGIESGFTYHKLSAAEIDQVIDTNLRGAMQLTRLVLAGMVERRRGHIVNMSSLAGRSGPAAMEPYAATKAALVGFTQSLRASYRGQGVSASVICPGFVNAGMYTDWQKDHPVHVPASLGVAKPEAVAAAVIKAIRDDLGDVIVNPRPVRHLMVFQAAFPGLAEKVSRYFDANNLFRDQAALREQERAAAAASAEAVAEPAAPASPARRRPAVSRRRGS